MTVAIIDYGSGNLRSAAKAFERAALECGSTQSVVVTADAKIVAQADRIVLPGVGAFGDCRRGLESLPDMIDTLNDVVITKGRPFFGICVGMQLMAERGLEYGVHQGLGWIRGEVKALAPNDASLKIPHMGWNELRMRRDHPVFQGLPDHAHAYFVHSYAMTVTSPEDVVADVDYGGSIVAAVGRANMIGTQFHPEKSQAIGLQLIANFLTWCP